LGVNNEPTDLYHLESNGQIQNIYRILNNGLTCEKSGQRDDWEICIDFVLWDNRSKLHSTVGCFPFFLGDRKYIEEINNGQPVLKTIVNAPMLRGLNMHAVYQVPLVKRLLKVSK
jgi:hypothetical protein